VERQRHDCQALADWLGWQVHGTYVDNDLSAWTGKRRPDYQRMLADIRAGKIDAVVVWHEDRLTRLPRELEEFADACLKAGVHRLVSCYGDTDLSNADDMLTLRIKARSPRTSPTPPAGHAADRPGQADQAQGGGAQVPAVGAAFVWEVRAAAVRQRPPARTGSCTPAASSAVPGAAAAACSATSAWWTSSSPRRC
jgi:hypothetical protein